VPPARPLPIEVSHEEEGRAGAPSWIVQADPRLPAAGGRPGPVAGDERELPPERARQPEAESAPVSEAQDERPGGPVPERADDTVERRGGAVADGPVPVQAGGAAHPRDGAVADGPVPAEADRAVQPSVAGKPEVPVAAPGPHLRIAVRDVPGGAAPLVPPAAAAPLVPPSAAARGASAIEPARGVPAPSIERALSGPAKDRIDGWRRRVKVVPGGQGPGKRDQETLDRDRARLPLAGPRRILFLGCTSGAGQTLTALMTGQMLAGLRGVPVAAIDLNPGHGSLSRQAQAAPVLTVAALLAGSSLPEVVKASARLDVIASDADPASSPVPDERDYARLAELTARHYLVAVVDPGASEVTRVLGIADQLVLVAPASGDAPRSLAMTQEWLGAHGHSDLTARAVTVINGVSKRSMTDVEQAEAVARGRCRAIVRIPWDDVLAAGPAGTSSLRPQTRHAYTALAGVLVAGLAAAPVPRKVLH
jgi:MinD-like ATPase involved in chromosome partitioning or flagellar assembly